MSNDGGRRRASRQQLCWTLLVLASSAAFGSRTEADCARCSAAGSSHGGDQPQRRPQQHSNSSREEAREMFMFGFRQYMQHAFPRDDLRPISCRGHDTQGGIANTLVDSLDTLLVVNAVEELRHAVSWTQTSLDLDVDVRAHVFELTIRSLGGLLSAHSLLIRDPALMPGYRDGLLAKAVDLADRLMPAFKTPSGIPLSWVNLRRGVLPGELRQTCTACATTLLLEFGTLSRLTGDAKYERVAAHAVRQVFLMRSRLGLAGNTLNVDAPAWERHDSGTGAGIDSYYEYLLKSYLLFGDEDYLGMFAASYVSAARRMRLVGDFAKYGWLVDVHMDTGALAKVFVSSLAAFWPGMQALIGQTAAAAELYGNWTAAWDRFGWLPEQFDMTMSTVHPIEKGYPLRPELMESTFMLYEATGDDAYLRAGEALQARLQDRNRVECGFAGISDVTTGALEDSMESFMLSETAKYLFLLAANATGLPSFFVLSTEGHLMPPFPTTPAEEDAEVEISSSGANTWWPNFSTAAKETGHSVSSKIDAELGLDADWRPETCAALCWPPTTADARAAAERLGEALPAVPTREADYLLLRERRCRACRVVAAALSAQGAAPSRRHPSQPAAAAAAAAATLGGGATVRQATPMQLKTLMQVLDSGPHIIRQVFCQFSKTDADGPPCAGMAEVQGGQPLLGLPRDGVVVQVAQDVPPLPRYVVTIDSNDSIGGVAVHADFEAIAAVFGPYLHFSDHCTAGAAAKASLDDASERGELAGVCGFAAPLVLAEPSRGCGGALSNAERVAGAVMAVDRGSCTFVEKVMTAERAGAEAVLVLNSVPDGEPSGGLMEMGDDGGRVLPSIPALMVTQMAGSAIRRLAEAAASQDAALTITIGPAPVSVTPSAAGRASGNGSTTRPLPRGTDQMFDEVHSGDNGADQCPDMTPEQERTLAKHQRLDPEDCPVQRLHDEECPTEGDEDEDGYCTNDARDDGREALSAPRQFENPLLRDYQPRQQRLEMVIPPHALPWVVQRIMGSGDPQGALVRIASFIDEVLVPDQAAEEEAQCPPGLGDELNQDSAPGQRAADPVQEEASREQSVEQRT